MSEHLDLLRKRQHDLKRRMSHAVASGNISLQRWLEQESAEISNHISVLEEEEEEGICIRSQQRSHF